MIGNPIRVILADDHALVLEGLRSRLMAEQGIQVAATATDGQTLQSVLAAGADGLLLKTAPPDKRYRPFVKS